MSKFSLGDLVALNKDISMKDLEYFNTGVEWNAAMIDIVLSGFIINSFVGTKGRLVLTTIDQNQIFIPVEFVYKVKQSGHPYTEIFKWEYNENN